MLTETIKKLKGYYKRFTVAGSGIQEDILKNRITNFQEIKYIGSVSNAKIGEMLLAHDILVLPSTFDGWGAVVNEALQSGTRVIASENCGASVLLDGDIRGEIFSFKKTNNLEWVLKKWLAKGKVTQEQRKELQEWSKKNISGEATTNYFEEIIHFVLGKSKNRPEAPWIKNKF